MVAEEKSAVNSGIFPEDLSAFICASSFPPTICAMEQHLSRSAAPKRYHPLMVLLHWLLALLIVVQAAIGVGVLHFWPNSAVKIAPLTLHMILGLAMLVLLLIQLVAHFVFPRPAPPASSNAFLRFIAKATHALLYLFALLMGASGILLALQSHVLQLVVGGKVGLPMYFNLFLHAAVFVMFGMICAFHVVAALYHQFILRDRLLSRMGFARETSKERPLGTLGRPADNL